MFFPTPISTDRLFQCVAFPVFLEKSTRYAIMEKSFPVFLFQCKLLCLLEVWDSGRLVLWWECGGGGCDFGCDFGGCLVL